MADVERADEEQESAGEAGDGRSPSDDELALPEDEELIEKASGRQRVLPSEPPPATALDAAPPDQALLETASPLAEDAAEEHRPQPTRWFEHVAGWLSFSVACLVALVLRIKDLGVKPLHNDEGVNGWFLLRLIEEGNYTYDPTNYHGPFLYFFGWLPLLAEPTSPVLLRLPQAVVGALCLLLLLPLRRVLGWVGVCATAWLFALGPLQVYYARHSIHETYVVFFTLLAVVVFLRYLERRGEWFAEGRPRLGADWTARTRLLTLGVGSLALIYANKETAIITYAALFAGLVLATGPGAFKGAFSLAFWRAGLALAKGGVTFSSERIQAAVDDVSAALEPNPLWRFASQEAGRKHRWWWSEAGPMFALATLLSVILGGLVVGVAGRVAVFGNASGNAWGVWSQGGEWFAQGHEWKAGVFAALGLVFLAVLLAGAPARTVREWLRAEPVQRRGWWIALAVAVGLHVVLFTSLFSWPKGLIDWALSLYHWVARGVASEKTGHEGKVVYYYLDLIWRYEAPLVVFAGLGWLEAVARRRPFGLFLMGWGMAIIAVYSILAYKTPWLVINLTLPLLLSAGSGSKGALDGLRWLTRRWKGALACLVPSLSAAVCISLPALALAPNKAPLVTPTGERGEGYAPWWWLIHDTNWRGPDDNHYEIIYGQTDRDLLNLVDRVLPHLEDGERLSIMSDDYWPLPFYLHGHAVGYPKTPPANLDRLIVIAPDQEAQFGDRLQGWGRETFILRPHVPLLLLTHPELAR